MYYNRTLSDDFSGLIEKGGSLRWLYDYVKQNKELDFLIGRNNNKEWISVYRGLSRVLTITKSGKKDNIVLDAAKAYKKLNRDFYGVKSCAIDFSKKFTKLISDVANNNKFDRYYKNEKEGYFQNILSRRYGICGKGNDDFVIIDCKSSA